MHTIKHDGKIYTIHTDEGLPTLREGRGGQLIARGSSLLERTTRGGRLHPDDRKYCLSLLQSK